MRLSKIVAVTALTFLPFAAGCGSDDPDDSRDEADASTHEDAGDIGADDDSEIQPDADDSDDASSGDDASDAGSDADAQSPEDGGPDADVEEDPCGNGIIDEGETCDGDCPTSCDDNNACTDGTLVGEPDQCTAECEFEPIAECEDYAGDYGGRYYILAEEKVGDTVVNSVSCEGTYDADVDLNRDDHFEGTAECAYAGGLPGYDGNQSATLSGGIGPNGSFTGHITHDFGTDNDGSFTVDGTLSDGVLTVDDTGSFYPNSHSTVAWEVQITLDDE